MSKNTVTLELEEYNKLRDFKKEIENGKVLEIAYYTGAYDFTKYVKFYTEDELITKLSEQYKELQAENKQLQDNIKELKGNIKQIETIKPKEISIDDVKKMTCREFRKWRRSELKKNDAIVFDDITY